MPRFSVNIIARDGEKTLKQTLNSVRDLTDDLMIVVDSRTQDNTLDIAKQFTSKVFIHDFIDFSSQRHFAVSQSAHDWILALDADEELSPELKDELNQFSQKSEVECSAYFLPRSNIIFGKAINHTNWDPDGIIRLFDKNQGSWVNPVHEQWQTTGKTDKFSGSIIHHNYDTVEEFVDKLNSYTSQETESQFNLSKLFFDPVYDFFRRLLWHAGFLDGWHGLYLAYLMAFYHLVAQVKTWQKDRLS